jgi:hypothetical protein
LNPKPKTMKLKNHVFDLNGFTYSCDVEVTAGGCVIDNLIFNHEDEDLNRPVRDMATLMLCKHELDSQFSEEIEEAKIQDEIENEIDAAEMAWEAKMGK